MEGGLRRDSQPRPPRATHAGGPCARRSRRGVARPHAAHRQPRNRRPRHAMTLPLEGVRVVEFSHMVMGPTCGLVLADLGAEVIKVEPEGKGDPTRYLKSTGAGFFAAFSRNKKSVTLDLASEAGLARARELARGADVFIENFRPGALEAKGLGYEALAKDNPRLV